MQVNTDLHTLQRVRRGDRHAISEIFESYHLKIFRYLFYKVGDVGTAEDLASEVFVRLIRTWAETTPDGTRLQAWLFKIARNLAIDHYRRHQSQNPDTLPDTVPSEDDPIDTTVQRILNHQLLYKAVNMLPFDQCEVIRLRFISELSIAESAQIMGRSEDAIKGLQRRALSALREILTDWEVQNV